MVDKSADVMVEVEDLVKWYGPTLAVDHLDLQVPKGQILGFLGPNGAGKSTTLRIITGFLQPTSGRAKIGGHDVFRESLAVRRLIGYLPEGNPLYPEMRVEEYLHYRGRLQRMPRSTRNQRIAEVCDRCGLASARRRLVGRLSRGNRQRVGLAAALLHEPPLLILDEPTAGLDPNQMTQVRRLIDDLRDRHTVILSTHILPEVERTADRVVIIANGRIVAQGTPDELRQAVAAGSRILIEARADANELVEALQQIEGVGEVSAAMRGLWCHAVVDTEEGGDIREALGEAMLSRRWVVREMRYEMATLEQYFVQVTAGSNRPKTTAATA